MTPPLPEGFSLVLDAATHVQGDGHILWGGAGSSVLRLTDAGVHELALARTGAPLSPAGRRLGRRLVSAGLAHPLPPQRVGQAGVTVIIPARDRALALARCLAAVGGIPTVVVDDGSLDPEAVERICRSYGARLIARSVNGGPAAARNSGIAEVDTPFVAFLDSDCMPPPGWIDALGGHFDDPLVAAVAPRIRPASPGKPTRSPSALERYLDQRCPLDLGSRPAAVQPLSLVPYVPTAALIVRRSALNGGFDEQLRFGEDVDFVWRLLDAGWQVRYDPSVTVSHTEPSTWRRMLVRRFRYGTSAGPLARRHYHRLSPVIVAPLPILILTALLLQQLLAAAVIAATGSIILAWKLRQVGMPIWRSPQFVLQAIAQFYRDAVHAAVTLFSPLLIATLIFSREIWAIAALLAAPYVLEWLERRPRIGPLRWIGARVVEDIVYGAGVWSGCASARAIEPLLPRVTGLSIRRSGRHRRADPRL